MKAEPNIICYDSALEGQDAHDGGIPITQNPYDSTTQPLEWASWVWGWDSIEEVEAIV
jgi:hypothetical protein